MRLLPRVTPAVDRPLFVIGTGRSGTSLFLDLLAFHPDVAWFSTYNERYPAIPWLSLLNRLHDLPLLDRWTIERARWMPRPTEAYGLLDRCTGSRFTLRRNLTAEDATEDVRRRFGAKVARQLALQGKARFLCKYTGVPRIRFIRAIFPDALFIHVCRDGRAVANSLLRVDWWSGDLSAWRYGEIDSGYLDEFEQSGRDPVVLAGIVWKTLMDAIEAECDELPADQVTRVRYDALVRDPVRTLEEVCRFSDLEPDPRFRSRIEGYPVSDMDDKWKRELSSAAQDALDRTIGEHLELYGFTG